MAEFLFDLALANLTASALILLVLLLRRPVRRRFGARVAYALWLLPLGSLAGFLPAPVREIVVAPAAAVAAPAVLVAPVAVESGPDLWALAFALWLAGVTAGLAWLALGHRRFLRAAARGRAGPAVVGVLRPRIVTPSDFDTRYTPRERVVVLAHEAMHLRRRDPQMNALAALVRCLSWFNPLVHLAVFHMRADQELACDAAVIGRHPKARRAYAEAMLKTQLAAQPLPLGCYWPAGAEHPLAERIAMLSKAQPGGGRIAFGAGLVLALGLGAGVAGWAAQPAETRFVEAAPQVSPPATPRAHEAPVPAPRVEKVDLVADRGPHRYGPRRVLRGPGHADVAAGAAPPDVDAAAETVAGSEVSEAVDGALAGLDARIDAEVNRGLAEARRDLAQQRREARRQALKGLDARVNAEVNRALAEVRQELARTDWSDLHSLEGLDAQINAQVSQALRDAAESLERSRPSAPAGRPKGDEGMVRPGLRPGEGRPGQELAAITIGVHVLRNF